MRIAMAALLGVASALSLIGTATTLKSSEQRCIKALDCIISLACITGFALSMLMLLK